MGRPSRARAGSRDQSVRDRSRPRAATYSCRGLPAPASMRAIRSAPSCQAYRTSTGQMSGMGKAIAGLKRRASAATAGSASSAAVSGSGKLRADSDDGAPLSTSAERGSSLALGR